jgi:hypothetical protein
MYHVVPSRRREENAKPPLIKNDTVAGALRDHSSRIGVQWQSAVITVWWLLQGGSGGNNDGLTKQQLDLIHQIMEQTQRQSQSASKPTTKPAAKPINKTPVKVQRVWTSTVSSCNNNNDDCTGI